MEFEKTRKALLTNLLIIDSIATPWKCYHDTFSFSLPDFSLYLFGFIWMEKTSFGQNCQIKLQKIPLNLDFSQSCWLGKDLPAYDSSGSSIQHHLKKRNLDFLGLRSNCLASVLKFFSFWELKKFVPILISWHFCQYFFA